MPHTKIIATIGPSSANPMVLRKMMREGLDIVRLNFSHGSHQSHFKVLQMLRHLNKKYRRSVAVMQDLEGYRIRVGKLIHPIELKKNSVVTLYQESGPVPGGTAFPIDLEGSFKSIPAGETIFIDDGKIVLRVLDSSLRRSRAKVVVGGALQSRKGINISNFRIQTVSLTEKDRFDVTFAVKHRVEYIAQSFVRTPDDIRALQDELRSHAYQCRILAKIESQEGINNVEKIIAVSDGIIVARGDLGISVSLYKLPIFQKYLVEACRIQKKTSVVATQMLDSMMQAPMPTRAEVSDVANAVLDGADMLLLSGETAAGKYPVLAVSAMNGIIKEIERSSYYRRSKS